MIDRATAEKIKDRADIVEVVGDYVHLIRRGANFMGLCPFHNERTPSFSVNKNRNFCYCFSCHKGGSPVNFIMEKEGISYHDALLRLAQKYGIKVEERELTDEERKAMSHRESLFLVNEFAMNFFSGTLLTREEGKTIGLQYLYSRGVTQEAIKQFKLGFDPKGSSTLTETALQKGINLDILKETGLTGTSQSGRNYDKFYGRVIFPVLNSSGKVVAFGGRDLSGSPAKYINSPESDIYKKSNELYGIFQAKNEIVRQQKCYLVEGYLDVIGMWQKGIKNVVASSGTALTDGQIALIHRLTNNVTLIYDGDAAGIKASFRGIDLLLANNLDIKVLLLPDGEDPDSFARKNSTEDFIKYITDNETDFIKFKANVLINDSQNDPIKRGQAVRSIVNSLAHIKDRIKRDIYIQECSTLLNIPEETIISEVSRIQAEIMQQNRLERRRNDLNNDIQKGRLDNQNPYNRPPNIATTNLQNGNSVNTVELESNNTKEKDKGGTSSLFPLEWKIIELCLKAGFSPLITMMGENDEERILTAIEFVEEELSFDNLEFLNEINKKIFNSLKGMIPSFKDSHEEFKSIKREEYSEKLKKGYDSIREKNLSMVEIEKEEKHLQKEIDSWYNENLNQHARNYPSMKLASHEDDEIRRMVTEAIKEPHQLSNIFSQNNSAFNEENRELNEILKALNVWKNGLLEKELKENLKKLKEISGNGSEEEIKIQSRITEIIRMRSQMAKDIGDRVINPRSLRN